MVTVLIVDDSRTSRRFLRNMLTEAGYEVVAEAVDGEDGMKKYEEFKPDIVTMDITMPVTDGVTALEKIKAYDNTADVIMVTSAGQQKKVIQALKLGAYEFCMKPLDKDELLKVFKELNA